MGLGLKVSIWYLGTLQIAAATISKEKLRESPHQLKPIHSPTPFYFHATIDPGVHLTLNAQINSQVATALVDSKATGIFMNQKFAQDCQTMIKAKEVPQEVRVIDGRVINSRLITHEAIVELKVENHQETLIADITSTKRYLCVLGTPWLVRHNPTIRWSKGEVLFDSPYCHQTCLWPSNNKQMINGCKKNGNSNYLGIVQNGKEVFQSPSTCPTKFFGTSSQKGLAAPKHAIVSAPTFRLSAKEVEVYALEISELFATTEIIKATKDSIPVEYQDLQGVFSEEASNKLPEHGVSDMKIEFKEGQEPRNTGLRPMSPVELEELRRYLEENLGKG